MPNSRTFSDVTLEALERMKTLGRTQHSVVFDPPDGPRSIATSQTPFGECVVEADYDIARAELTLTLVKKPWLIPAGLLWSGFLKTLEYCRGEAEQQGCPDNVPKTGSENPLRTADDGPDA